PLTVTKEQVVTALKLIGLEFQDAEIETMLRGVNQAMGQYASLRKLDIPLDTEPAFSFRPGLPDRAGGTWAEYSMRWRRQKAVLAGGNDIPIDFEESPVPI
ncbi:MAG: hypothetical protein L3K09_03240, partial [Thermoplasmata archaeon]|nr:hypothetical protein [Thermoplasmata archaeon]